MIMIIKTPLEDKIPSEMEVAPRYELLALVILVRAGVKKTFFYFRSKRGGVSANQKNPYQKILRFF